jgi:hypothetical protein
MEEFNNELGTNFNSFEEFFDYFDFNYNLRSEINHADSNGAYKFSIWECKYPNNIGKWYKHTCMETYLDKKNCKIKCLIKLIDIYKENKNEI